MHFKFYVFGQQDLLKFVIDYLLTFKFNLKEKTNYLHCLDELEMDFKTINEK